MRFTNLDGSGPINFGDVLRWSVIDKLRGRRRKSPGTAPMEMVRPDLLLLRTPPALGEPARITWIGHATFLVQLDGISLLIDPVLGDRISGIIKRNVALPLTPAELPRIDACLVTHSHYDHLDLPSLRKVAAPILAGTGVGGIVGPPCSELGWWDSDHVGGVKVTFVPAQHWSRRGLADANETLWGGFVIEGSKSRLYHSGDTAFFEGFAEIGRRFPGIGLAMLPIGAYDPAWFMERQHMNPEQATQAFVDLGASQFVAMHWGTFKLTDEPLDEPPQRLRAEWARRKLDPAALHLPAIGATVADRK